MASAKPDRAPSSAASVDGAGVASMWFAAFDSGLHIWRSMVDMGRDALRAQQDMAMASWRAQIAPTDTPASPLENSLATQMMAPYLAMPALWRTMTQSALARQDTPAGLVD